MPTLKDVKLALRLDVADNCYLRPLVEADVTRSYVDGLNNLIVNQYLVASRKQKQTLDSARAYVRANHESDSDLYIRDLH